MNPRSESMLEMAAEKKDPALWAAMQLLKPDAGPFATQGEAIDAIRRIFDDALAMRHSLALDRVVQLEQAVRDLKTLAGVIARGDTREDRISKSLEANRIAFDAGCMDGVIG